MLVDSKILQIENFFKTHESQILSGFLKYKDPKAPFEKYTLFRFLGCNTRNCRYIN